MSDPMIEKPSLPSETTIDLDRDLFMRRLIRVLAGTLEEVIGLEEAEGYISLVGTQMGEHIGEAYRTALGVEKLDRTQVGDALVDLKRRIEGEFYIIEETEDRIVLGNRRCPFGEFVKGRPSLCMMTSNVFGHVAAENLGYARVDLEETIAMGHNGCRVTIYLRSAEQVTDGQREYFSSDTA